jgi:hypothetical protein
VHLSERQQAARLVQLVRAQLQLYGGGVRREHAVRASQRGRGRRRHRRLASAAARKPQRAHCGVRRRRLGGPSRLIQRRRLRRSPRGLTHAEDVLVLLRLSPSVRALGVVLLRAKPQQQELSARQLAYCRSIQEISIARLSGLYPLSLEAQLTPRAWRVVRVG